MRALQLSILAVIGGLTGGCGAKPAQPHPGPQDVMFAASPEQLWAALIELYTDYSLPIAVIDKQSWLLRSETIVSAAGSSVLGVPNDDGFDCGFNGFAPVRFSITSLLRPQGDSVALRTRVVAEARERQCTSRGAVEQAWARELAARLKAGGN